MPPRWDFAPGWSIGQKDYLSEPIGGARLSQIGALLGHKSTNTTQRYIGQDDYLDDSAADYIKGI